MNIKGLTLVLLILQEGAIGVAQTAQWRQYLNYQNYANSYYVAANYTNAERTYDIMDSTYGNIVSFGSMRQYVASAIHNGHIDKAKDLLKELMSWKCFTIAILNDQIFDTLKSHKDWPVFDSLANIYGHKSQPYIDSLTAIRYGDSLVRSKFVAMLSRLDTSITSPQIPVDKLNRLQITYPDSFASFNSKMAIVDSANTLRLRKVIDMYGFPTWELVGEHIDKAFYIAMHADLDFLEWFTKQYYRVMNDGNAPKERYGMLKDRCLTQERQPILYGCQGRKGKWPPIEDIEHLNDRRESLHLFPLDTNNMQFFSYDDTNTQ